MPSVARRVVGVFKLLRNDRRIGTWNRIGTGIGSARFLGSSPHSQGARKAGMGSDAPPRGGFLQLSSVPPDSKGEGDAEGDAEVEGEGETVRLTGAVIDHRVPTRIRSRVSRGDVAGAAVASTGTLWARKGVVGSAAAQTAAYTAGFVVLGFMGRVAARSRNSLTALNHSARHSRTPHSTHSLNHALTPATLPTVGLIGPTLPALRDNVGVSFERLGVGHRRYCSPRHRMPFNSRNVVHKCVSMTCRASAWQMLLATS